MLATQQQFDVPRHWFCPLKLIVLREPQAVQASFCACNIKPGKLPAELFEEQAKRSASCSWVLIVAEVVKQNEDQLCGQLIRVRRYG